MSKIKGMALVLLSEIYEFQKNKKSLYPPSFWIYYGITPKTFYNNLDLLIKEELVELKNLKLLNKKYFVTKKGISLILTRKQKKQT